MEGVVLHYDEVSNKGLIKSSDGTRFEFARDGWNAGDEPRQGLEVDFVVENEVASGIYVTGTGAAKSKLANTKESSDDKTIPMVVYILYLVSLITGGLLGIIGVIVAYVNIGSSSQINASHFRYQIRTFWIGMLYAFVGIATTFLYVGVVILLFVVVWYIVRSVFGLSKLNKGEEIINVKSWLVR